MWDPKLVYQLHHQNLEAKDEPNSQGESDFQFDSLAQQILSISFRHMNSTKVLSLMIWQGPPSPRLIILL